MLCISEMPVKRKATAAQKGKTVAEKRAERAPPPVVEESESQSAAQSQSSRSVPILEEREGASAPAPAPPTPPLNASGQDVEEAIHLLTQLVAAQTQRHST